MHIVLQRLTRLTTPAIVTLGLLTASSVSLAQANAQASVPHSPVGVWKSIDDETGKPKAIITISDNNGQLAG
ncbi:MAG: hypothetical protein RR758_00910, partial [Burkholderiaceae bacterium]